MCTFPCATCGSTPTACGSCAFGYQSGSQPQTCVAAVSSCNSQQNCQYCASGYVLVSSNTNTTVNQICQLCNANCSRCSASNVSSCTACSNGYYLNTAQACIPCSKGCMTCTSLSICLSCQIGYVAQTMASLVALSTQPVSCVACASPCATCSGSTITCLTCIPSYTIQGSLCISNFNYQMKMVLATNITIFNPKYLSFLTSIASSISTSINNIAVLSIVNGSVTVTMLITSTNSPSSNGAITEQNNLNGFKNGGSIAGMSITSNTVTTNGGTNNDSNDSSSGLSQTTIIILATVIPIGTLCNFYLI